MAVGGSKSKAAPKSSKRVEAETPTTSLKRAKDGSAFVKCGGCGKSVPAVLITMHDCSLDAKIKMNLESQIVEKPTEVKKTAERKKLKPKTEDEAQENVTPNSNKKRKLRKIKDPNMPKRPPTAFFVFMDEFRKSYKEANPDSKNVSAVSKEAGEKWRNMSEEEKKPYLDKAAELKAEYDKAMEAYNAENGNEEADAGKKMQEILEDEDA
ncbi:High mobility group box domain [Dillenia turbinata]|uniref:High mobility group box domain n=1 Tax=Dillenia turbinata TaxID=194707 RepID=A0AAN8VE11_9MAGN